MILVNSTRQNGECDCFLFLDPAMLGSQSHEIGCADHAELKEAKILRKAREGFATHPSDSAQHCTCTKHFMTTTTANIRHGQSTSEMAKRKDEKGAAE